MKNPDVTLFALLKKGIIQNLFDAQTYMKYVDKKKDIAREMWGELYAAIYFGSGKELMAKVSCREEDMLPAGEEKIEFYKYNRSEYTWDQVRYDEFIKDVFAALDSDREEKFQRKIKEQMAKVEIARKAQNERKNF